MDGDYDLNEQLKQDAVKVFDAAFEKVDFSNGAAAAELINKWVNKKYAILYVTVQKQYDEYFHICKF